MGVILDSSVVIHAERTRMKEAELLRAVSEATGDPFIALSAVGVTEIAHGIYRADTSARSLYRRTFLNYLLLHLPVYEYTLAVALLAGQIDGQQAAIGKRVPFADLMIGATALHQGFSVMTTNLRHFRQIPNLQVIPF